MNSIGQNHNHFIRPRTCRAIAPVSSVHTQYHHRYSYIRSDRQPSNYS
jgi:hypothetical protein